MLLTRLEYKQSIKVLNDDKHSFKTCHIFIPFTIKRIIIMPNILHWG